MADYAAVTAAHGHPGGDVTERDFLKLVAGSAAAIGVGAIGWSFLDSLNPPQDVLALSSVDVDLAPIAVGSGITVPWQGKPVFVRHHTAQEIKAAEGVRRADLIDPQSDAARVKPGHADWIVVVGACTHLGCVPLGNKPADPRGDWGGWFCPCHGSHYDTSGRVRHGSAPANLALPPDKFDTATKLTIG